MREESGRNEQVIADIHKAVFEDGHRTVLVFGPPGSGKTYVAAQLAAKGATRMREGQKALVLTFSVNAADQITQEVRKALKAFDIPANKVEVLNYHALYKRLLDAYGRYCGLPRQWRTWMLHEVREALRDLTEGTSQAKARDKERDIPWELSNAVWLAEKLGDANPELRYPEPLRERAADILRSHHRQGLLHYDSWAYYAHRLLWESDTLRQHVGNRYPLVIVDEFQDTNGVEWAFIRELARGQQLVCMADRHQEIYQWKGANAALRLRRLRHERQPESPDGFRLAERVRHRDSPELADFAVAVRDMDCQVAAKVAVPGSVKIRGIVPGPGDCGWRGPCRTYAGVVRRAAEDYGSQGHRIGVLCPTWPLLAGVSHALREPWGGAGPLPHAIAGTDEQVGGFLGALAHALIARLSATAGPPTCMEAESALNEMICVAQGVGRDAVWFGPRRTRLPEKAQGRSTAHERRRDAVCTCLADYACAEAEVRTALEDVPALAEGMRGAMGKGLQASTWIVDPFVNRPLDIWHGRLTEYVRRRPDATVGQVVAAAWRAVEECVARERRLLNRRDVVLMTADAAKGKEFHTTIVCGASQGSRRLDTSKKGPECKGVRNLWHVACSRSRERVIILYEERKPACFLSALQGQPCPRPGEGPAGRRKARQPRANPDQLNLFQ